MSFGIPVRNGLGVGLLASTSLSTRNRVGFSPASLFTAGEQGFWGDPSDFSTMFQDSAGTTPVTAVGQPVGLWLDKSGRGNHAPQPTAASRPILGRVPVGGRRNLLTFTEEFDNASWTKTNTAVTPNNAIAPDGTLTADTVTSNAVSSTILQSFVFEAATYRFSIWLRRVSGTGVVEGTLNNFAYTNFTLTSEWQRFSFSHTTTAGNNGFQVRFGSSGDVVEMWGAQLEPGTVTTAYQRVGTAFDVTQAGVPDCYYLAFDGTDDFLLTGTITPGTDKAQVFAGVRKLGTATAILVELSDNTNTNAGSFYIGAPDTSAAYSAASHGSAGIAVNQISSVTGLGQSPDTAVISTLADIAADSTIIRRNGLAYPAGTGDQGTGNYLAYPLYIGRRGGTSLPFNGQIFSLIVRFGASLPTATITQIEAWVGQRVAPTVNVPQFGPDLILNGDFASGANWTPTGGWSISAGAARQASVGFANIVYQAQALTAGATYAATFTVSSISSGSIGARLSGATIVASATFTAPGTYTVYVVAPVSTTQFDIIAAASTVAVVDDVSLRLVS